MVVDYKNEDNPLPSTILKGIRNYPRRNLIMYLCHTQALFWRIDHVSLHHF